MFLTESLVCRALRATFAFVSLIALGVACASARVGLGEVVAPAHRVEIESTVFLIGDAGGPARSGDPVLIALARDVAASPGVVVAVFLGDNVYPKGLPDSSARDRAEGERRLDAQLATLPASGARAIFVPGNHDWAKHGAGGWEAVRRQGRYISERSATRATLLPGDGCPGPSVIDIGSQLRILALDTQWWLHGGPKPVDPTSSCPADSETEVVDSIRSALREGGTRKVLVVAHHPLAASGPHAGRFGFLHHVFPLRELKSWLWVPLPVIGSAYPIARIAGISSQDLAGSENEHMRDALRRAFADRPPLVYASGHEHGLEVFADTTVKYVLVSGAGNYGHTDPIGRRDAMRFASRASGYMKLEVLNNGRVRLAVLVVDAAGTAVERFSAWLD